VKNLPRSSILSYPLPELGRRISGTNSAIKATATLIGDDVEDAELVRRLMTYYNFYSETNRATLTLTGRILELVITSLIRDVTVDGILDLIYRAPFHSATAIASTKAFDFDDDDESDSDIGDIAVGDTLSKLVDEINAWRGANEADLASPPNAWLIYNVVNKYFNQANYFHQAAKRSASGGRNGLGVYGTALRAFRAIWAIFGSFEKGPIFGFDEVIAYRNIDAIADFEQNQLYLQNIKPFLQKNQNAYSADGTFFNFHTGAYTYLLASHPLKALLERVHKNLEILPADVQDSNPEVFPSRAQPITEMAANSLLNRLFKNEYAFHIRDISGMSLEQLRAIRSHTEQGLPPDIRAQIIQMGRDIDQKSGGSALSKLNRLLAQIDRLENQVGGTTAI
jgi:hypothetical protein